MVTAEALVPDAHMGRSAVGTFAAIAGAVKANVNQAIGSAGRLK